MNHGHEDTMLPIKFFLFKFTNIVKNWGKFGGELWQIGVNLGQTGANLSKFVQIGGKFGAYWSILVQIESNFGKVGQIWAK